MKFTDTLTDAQATEYRNVMRGAANWMPYGERKHRVEHKGLVVLVQTWTNGQYLGYVYNQAGQVIREEVFSI